MEVILLERVTHLGQLGDKVKVKAGFGRNFLIPQGKAVPANDENLKSFESRRAELEKAAAELVAAAKQRAEKLAALAITITAQASDDGKLYGSISTKEIAEAIVKAGEDIHKREVLLSDGAIRAIGEYEVRLQLHSDVTETIKLVVEAEK